VTKLEQGSNVPRPDKLGVLARALEVTPEQLTHFAISLGRSEADGAHPTARDTVASYALDPTRPRPLTDELGLAHLPTYLRRLVEADIAGELPPRLAAHLESHVATLLDKRPADAQLELVEELSRRLLSDGEAEATALRVAVELLDGTGPDADLLETVLDRLITDARLEAPRSSPPPPSTRLSTSYPPPSPSTTTVTSG
jgi:hypothetical protein